MLLLKALPLLVGVVDDRLQLFRGEGVEDVEEPRPVDLPPLGEPVWHVRLDEVVILVVVVDLGHVQFLEERDVDRLELCEEK